MKSHIANAAQGKQRPKTKGKLFARIVPCDLVDSNTNGANSREKLIANKGNRRIQTQHTSFNEPSWAEQLRQQLWG